MPAWVVWLAVAAALGVAGVATLTLSLGLIAVGALVAAVASTGLPLAFQLMAFGAPPSFAT